jgi:hypothetical protein
MGGPTGVSIAHRGAKSIGVLTRFRLRQRALSDVRRIRVLQRRTSPALAGQAGAVASATCWGRDFADSPLGEVDSNRWSHPMRSRNAALALMSTALANPRPLGAVVQLSSWLPSRILPPFALLTPEALLRIGLGPAARVLDPKGRLRCRGRRAMRILEALGELTEQAGRPPSQPLLERDPTAA